jgi:DNA-binding CsgD family transcriptional regulator
LAQSWRRAREYERLEALLRSASGVLERSGSAVVVLAEPLHELTPGALVSLYRFFGRPGIRDPLPVRVQHWLEAQRSLASDADLELARPLQATLDGRQLVLRFLPGLQGDSDVILLDERHSEPPRDVLRDIGLTEREGVVLRLLTSGATNAAIAQQLSLSPWTVKRHLANVYTKLGVTGRVQAVAVALEIEAHHGATTMD